MPAAQIVLTAALSIVGALLLSVLQRKREDQVRWAPARREAYSAFLTSVDRWEELDYEAAVNGEIEEWFEAPPEDRLDPLLGVMTTTRLRPRANAAATTVHERLNDLELFGSSAVFARARALRDQMGALSSVRRDSPPRACGGSSPEHNARQEKFRTARDAYVSAVRSDLGA